MNLVLFVPENRNLVIETLHKAIKSGYRLAASFSCILY